MSAPDPQRPWHEKLVRSGYFLAAVLLHMVVFLLVASYVVFRPPTPPPDFSIRPHELAAVPVPPAPPPHDPVVADTEASVHPSTSTPVISGDQPSDFHMPPIGPLNLTGAPGFDPGKQPPIRVSVHGELSQARLHLIAQFERVHRSREAIANHDAAGTYPVYVASYADGDWDCNIFRDDKGNIVAGSMPDLAAKIAEWSHGEIKAQVVPMPLNIGGPELLDTKPPFIFFTGHKDFVLTDREIKNLQDYLEEGGAIWGDNALAGRGSRFDVAFRREMKRVVPDKDKTFEPLPLGADLFAKEKFPLQAVPAGMNYFAEPIEHLDIDGQVAILYTPNDYSDLYALRILPGDMEIQGPQPPRDKSSPLFTDGTFLYNNAVFFRNFSLQSSLVVHRLGMNIVTFLITRFDDELLLSPP